MLRKHETFVPGEYYHLYNRGIDKRSIFKSSRDYERFISLLYVANSENSIRLDDLKKSEKNVSTILRLPRKKELVAIGAWCLMGNHFHLLVQEGQEGGISKFMKKLGTGYSMYFNIKYQRTGALFGGPFKSKHIDNDRHLKHLFGYIHLNPLDIKFPEWENTVEKNKNIMKEFLALYQYSSFLDYLHHSRLEKVILSPNSFPNYFEASNDFENFVESYLAISKVPIP